MKLLVDIGNTRTKWALADGQSTIARGAELNSGLESLLLPNIEIDAAIASSVATSFIAERVSSEVLQQAGCKLRFAEVEKSACGLRNNYRVLDKLGVDRWVAAIGAYKRYPNQDIVVIDAGTAVTIDWVSKRGAFEGGVILPGLTLMHDSLVGNAAGIDSKVSEVSSVIGKSTEECVNSGAFFGLIGAIDRVVKEIVSARSNSSESCRVLVCGGDAEALIARLPINFQLESDLIFDGLRVLASQAQSE